MKCKNCGSTIREGASFCLNCGAQVQAKKKGSAQGGVKALIIVLVCSLVLLSGVAAYAILSGRLGGNQTAPDAEPAKTTVIVANVLGKKAEKAAQELKDSGLEVTTEAAYSDSIPEGYVIWQDLKAGDEFEAGTVVTLTVSAGKNPEPTTDPEPVSKYGSGSTTWKGLTASYRQTGEGLVDLKFENTGDYKFEIWFMNTGDFGITVFAFTEDGQSKKVIIKDYGSVLNIDPYNGSVSISSVKFDGLEGKITEIQIMNVRYKNMNNNYDFGSHDGPLSIKDGSK